MSKQKKCPKCGFKGSMNSFRKNERINHKNVKSVEHYCPKCKTWVKIED